MNWDSFSFDFRLEHNAGEVFTWLIEIEGFKEAALNLFLPPIWQDQLDRLNRVRAVYGTTALEGNPLSEAEVSHQIDQVGSDNKATKEQLQIRNAARAQAWVRQRFRPGETPPITLGDILDIHRMTTEQSDEKNNRPGSLRTNNVTVGSEEAGGVHRGAPAERVQALMEDYISFVNSKKMLDQHPVTRALLAHFFLVTIHPFGDGNGRVSRLVEAGILFQSQYNVLGFYGLSNYFYQNEVEYKTCLQQSRTHSPFDVTSFVSFGLRGFSEELKGINNFIKTKMNRLVYGEMLLRAFNRKTGVRRRLLNRREYSLLRFLITETEPTDPFSESPSRIIALDDLRDAPYIRAAYAKVSPRTFVRELLRLRNTGFIKFEQDETTRIWHVSLDLQAIGRY